MTDFVDLESCEAELLEDEHEDLFRQVPSHHWDDHVGRPRAAAFGPSDAIGVRHPTRDPQRSHPKKAVHGITTMRGPSRWVCSRYLLMKWSRPPFAPWTIADVRFLLERNVHRGTASSIFSMRTRKNNGGCAASCWHTRWLGAKLNPSQPEPTLRVYE